MKRLILAVLALGLAAGGAAAQQRQEAVALVSKATVAIDVQGLHDRTQDIPNLPGFDFGNGQTTPADKVAFKNSATGFVIDAVKGYVVTTDYNVGGAEKIGVTLSDGSMRDAVIVGEDKASDIAVLHIDPAGLSAVAWRDDVPTVGEDCLVYGQASTLGLVATSGTVAGVGLHMPEETADDLIVITNLEPRGMAGAAVFDTEGRVFGMAYARMDTDAQQSVGLGIALTAQQVRAVSSRLISAAGN